MLVPRNLMKAKTKILCLFSLFSLFFFSYEINALSNTKILEICKKEINKKACIKELKNKRSDLNDGKPIEIEVFPFND